MTNVMETQLFTFFIICDCRDPSLFHVEATAMSNYRLRYSAMKSTFQVALSALSAMQGVRVAQLIT